MKVMQNKFTLAATAGIAATLFVSACGKSGSDSKAPEYEVVEIPLGVTYDTSQSFMAEASVTDWTIAVSGCKSGYTTSVTSTSAAPKTAVGLYKFDQSCVAGLEKFTYGTSVFTKQGGGTLSGVAGTSATFESGTKILKVSISTQLDSPLSASSKAAFNFFEISKGTDSLPPGTKYSQGQSLSISGVEAPNFEINDVELTAIAATDGAPTFSIKLECNNAIASGACSSASGDPQPMASMDVKIVDDTFGGTPAFADAETLFATAGTTPTTDGTIGTKGGMSAVLLGAGPLYSHRNTIVFIRYAVTGGASYRYFNMDIGEPITP